MRNASISSRVDRHHSLEQGELGLEVFRFIMNDARFDGIPMVLDEVVTGFRLAPGGAQQRFNVKADIVCLAKILAGGMPGGLPSASRGPNGQGRPKPSGHGHTPPKKSSKKKAKGRRR